MPSPPTQLSQACVYFAHITLTSRYLLFRFQELKREVLDKRRDNPLFAGRWTANERGVPFLVIAQWSSPKVSLSVMYLSRFSNCDLLVSFVVTFQKDRFEISLPTTATVANLKERLAVLTNVPKENQKLMFKGIFYCIFINTNALQECWRIMWRLRKRGSKQIRK